MTGKERLIDLFKKIEYTAFPEMTMKANFANQFTDYALNIIAEEMIKNGVTLLPFAFLGRTNGKTEILNRWFAAAKAEAFKEFAERLKEKSFTHEIPFEANADRFIKLVAVEDIDNLVKEMTAGAADL